MALIFVTTLQNGVELEFEMEKFASFQDVYWEWILLSLPDLKQNIFTKTRSLQILEGNI